MVTLLNYLVIVVVDDDMNFQFQMSDHFVEHKKSNFTVKKKQFMIKEYKQVNSVK
jgi:hypothetical protein